jgi:hypothetical protein
LGGGGTGTYQTSAGSFATAGTANTGGGGGGCTGTSNATNGGSGVVIIAYPSTNPALVVGAGLTYSVSTVSRSGYRVYTFTQGTGTVTI